MGDNELIAYKIVTEKRKKNKKRIRQGNRSCEIVD